MNRLLQGQKPRYLTNRHLMAEDERNHQPFPKIQILAPEPAEQDADSQSTHLSTPTIPDDLTQDHINANPQLKRFQQDLLILTSFNENESLHWRPSWFPRQDTSLWTLYNPPNIVTDLLPHSFLGRKVYTRRMRHADDPAPYFIKTWTHWDRICKLHSMPPDLLCEKQIQLMRLGLPRNNKGEICRPPTHPLYPSPPTPSQGPYTLDPKTYSSQLPRKFHNLNTSGLATNRDRDRKAVVVVHPTGEMRIEDYAAAADDVRKEAGALGRRRWWSYVPWTREMDDSCKEEDVEEEDGVEVIKLRLRFWNSAMQ